jgi:hypothetical protein
MPRAWSRGRLAQEEVIPLKEGTKEGNMAVGQILGQGLYSVLYESMPAAGGHDGASGMANKQRSTNG